ncbi:MAG: PPC domain-containing protein [Anaerolineae bacterium]|nr:PPC domain-containing protein [Anaerolineae bacterium]
MRPRSVMFLLLALLAALLSSFSAAAQFGGSISYGASLIGSLSSDVSSAVYTFEGNTGDLVNIRAFGVGGALNPSLSLLDPNNAPITTSVSDLYTLQTSDAALSYFLPSDGTYRLIVTAEGGTSGDYLLQVRGRPASAVPDMPHNTSNSVTVPRDGTPQLVNFEVGQDCQTTLTVTSLTAGVPFTFPYLIRVRDENGFLVGQARGGRQVENRISFFPDSGIYQLEFSAIPSEALSDGELVLSSTCFEQQPTCDVPVLPPSIPPTPTPTPTPASGQLALIQQGGNLEYYQAATNVIGEGAPQVLYTFNGIQGDLVNVQVIGLSLDFDPQATLVSPSGQIIGTSQDDLFSFNETDAAISAFLQETGIYNVLISGENGTGGAFVVRVIGRPPVAARELGFGQQITFEAPPLDASPALPNPPQYFTFEANSECPTTLVFSNQSGGDPYTFPFVFTVRDNTGTIVTQMIGGRQTEDRVIVAPQSGRFEVEILAARPDARGQLDYRTTCAGEALLCETFTEIPVAPLPTAVPLTPSLTPTSTATPRIRITWTFTPNVTDTATPLPPTWTPWPPTDQPVYPTYTPTLTPSATPTETPVPICQWYQEQPPVCEPGEETNCECPDCQGNPIWEMLCNPTPDHYCGDGICDTDETYFTCPSDCLG